MYKRIMRFISKLAHRMYFRTLIHSFSLYQPVFYRGEVIKSGDRSSWDRWEMIKSQIKSLNAQSVVDLGSAEGFYVIQAAKECGCFALGIEANPNRVSIAQNQLVFEKINSAGFLFGVIDYRLIEKLPQFDLVIFMSVLHHMMYKHGESHCRTIMQKLRSKIGKAMIFEMGQSDEKYHDWSNKLPDMGANPHEWIEQFLRSCGFSKVTKIGESDSYRSSIKRAIFRVEP